MATKVLNKKMNKSLVASMLALALAGCASQPSDQPFTLNIAHINDTHSHFDASEAQLTLEGNQLYGQVGGHPRLLAYAQEVSQHAAKEKQPFLWLHAGGAFEGSNYYALNKGAMNADILSRMELDAMVLGNDELAAPPATLTNFIEAADFPLLAANVSGDALPHHEQLAPYVLYAFKGHKKQRVASVKEAGKRPVVAVIGLADPSLTSSHYQVEQAAQRAQQTVDELTEQGVKYIVALTHLGLAQDKALAETVNGIDVIVGGQSRELQGDFSNIGWHKGTPYAEQVNNANGHGSTCIVQAGHAAQAVGQVKVTFKDNGQVSLCEGTNTVLLASPFYTDVRRDESTQLGGEQQAKVAEFIQQQPNLALVSEDKSLRSHIDKQYRPALNAAAGKVIGYVPRRLSSEQLTKRGQVSQVAPLVAASQLTWVNSPEVQAVTQRQVDFAIVAAGAVHKDLEVGSLNEGQVTLSLVVPTPVSVVSLSGHQLTGFILEAVKKAMATDANGSSLPYVAGLRYQFNETRQGMGYLAKLEYQAQGKWQRIAPNETYQVAIAGDYDNNQALYEAQQVLTDRLDLATVEGKLVSFPVARISKEGADKFEVHYINQPLQCQAADVQCDILAQAVIAAMSEQDALITALPESGVTLKQL